jgi:hypothetical protein
MLVRHPQLTAFRGEVIAQHGHATWTTPNRRECASYVIGLSDSVSLGRHRSGHIGGQRGSAASVGRRSSTGVRCAGTTEPVSFCQRNSSASAQRKACCSLFEAPP